MDGICKKQKLLNANKTMPNNCIYIKIMLFSVDYIYFVSIVMFGINLLFE